MYVILELLFGVFQCLAYSGKTEDDETKQSTANIYVAVAVVLVLLLVVILIYVNNPEPAGTRSDMV